MTPDVVKVQTFADFTLEAEFADGTVRRFDMTPLLGYPAFSALREGNLFLSAKVRNGSVTWTDEIDLSPDTLYLRGETVSHDDIEKLITA
jgi:hypothetical protein